MEVLEIVDQKDGSCIVKLNISEEENRLLVEYAIIKLLSERIEKLDVK